MKHMWQDFSQFFPVFLIAVVGVLFLSFIKVRKGDLKKRIIYIDALLILTISGIFLVTLVPLGNVLESPRMINLIPFLEIYDMIFQRQSLTGFIWNVGINIILFVPFGFLIALRRVWKHGESSAGYVAFSGLMLSFFIESFQLIFPMGRMADVDDLIINTLGAYTGYIIFAKFFTE
jgi:glycopeptide antibiotics resistance protein